MKSIITTVLFLILFCACSHPVPKKPIVDIKRQNDSIRLAKKRDSLQHIEDVKNVRIALKNEDELKIAFHNDTTDTQRDKLKGKVKSIKEMNYGEIYGGTNLESVPDIKSVVETILPKDTAYKQPLPFTMYNFINYDVNGRNKQSKGILMLNKKYDGKGRLISYSTQFNRYILYYDTNGYVVRTKTYTTNFNDYTVSLYKDGKIVKTIDTVYIGNGNYTTNFWTDYIYQTTGLLIYRSTPQALIEMRTYDTHGNQLIESRLSKLIQGNTFLYDINGNLVSEEDTFYQNSNASTQYRYINDEQGNWILKIGQNISSSGILDNKVTVVKRIIYYYK